MPGRLRLAASISTFAPLSDALCRFLSETSTKVKISASVPRSMENKQAEGQVSHSNIIVYGGVASRQCTQSPIAYYRPHVRSRFSYRSPFRPRTIECRGLLRAVWISRNKLVARVVPLFGVLLGAHYQARSAVLNSSGGMGA
jgi:hypothetical protein